MNVSAICSKPDCEELAVVFWPAFDRNLKPEPFCAEHAEEAKRHSVLDGPRLLDMTKRKDLVAV